MSNESTINFVFVSRLNDGAAEIRIETNSRSALQDALLSLGLASPSQFAEPKAAAPEVAKGEVQEAAPKKGGRAPKATKAEVTDVVAKEEAAPEVAPEVATNVAEQAAPEAEQAAPAVATATVSVEEAAAAVRAYGAKNGLHAARELLQSFGFARTTEVTADKAADVLAAATL